MSTARTRRSRAVALSHNSRNDPQTSKSSGEPWDDLETAMIQTSSSPMRPASTPATKPVLVRLPCVADAIGPPCSSQRSPRQGSARLHVETNGRSCPDRFRPGIRSSASREDEIVRVLRIRVYVIQVNTPPTEVAAGGAPSGDYRIGLVVRDSPPSTVSNHLLIALTEEPHLWIGAPRRPDEQLWMTLYERQTLLAASHRDEYTVYRHRAIQRILSDHGIGVLGIAITESYVTSATALAPMPATASRRPGQERVDPECGRRGLIA